MLVKIGADWCGYCKRMARETFVDSRIVRHVNECFIPVTLDAERNADLARRMGAEALPTTVIVTPDTRIVQRITGFRTAEQLGSDLTRYCGAEKRHRGASDLRTHDFGRRQPVRNRNDRFSLLPADVRALTISVSQMR